MIHANADRTTLALLRVWIFGIWLVRVMFDPIEQLSVLPPDLFRPPGFLRLVPASLWSDLLSKPSLLAFRWILLALLALMVLGAFRRPHVPVLVALMVATYQGLVRGYSGHMNHAELVLLWATVIIAFFPMSEVLSVRRPSDPSPDIDRCTRAAVLAVTLLFAASYFFVGSVRLWKGLDLFTTDSLRNYIATQWATFGELQNGVYRLPHGSPIFAVLPAWVFQVLFVGATVLELAAPLVVVSRWARRTIPIGLVLFHLANIIWLQIYFIDDLLMLVVFSNIWFPKLGRTLAELESRMRASAAPARTSR